MSTLVTLDELADQQVELLPSRQTMALINVAPVIGVNIALAVNAATINSTANAVALQYLTSVQQ
jgi:hypothetical protein